MKFKLFTNFSSLLFWDVTQCGLVVSYQHFGEAVQEECLLGLLMYEMKSQRSTTHTLKNGALTSPKKHVTKLGSYTVASVLKINLLATDFFSNFNTPCI